MVSFRYGFFLSFFKNINFFERTKYLSQTIMQSTTTHSTTTTTKSTTSATTTSIPITSASVEIPSGIFHNYKPSYLLDKGYSIVYDKEYGHITTTAEIDAIRRNCSSSSILCMGGRENSTGLLMTVACGNCEIITRHTAVNQINFNNGVFWYNTPNYSIGFSPNASIYQNTADFSNFESIQRLSWHLDHNHGGWRLGNILDLNYDTLYYKMFFLKR
jgi:hypothetical protein